MMSVFCNVAPCSVVEVYRVLIVLVIEAASTSETSVNLYQTTRRYNPEDSHLHTRRRENLKSYQFISQIIALQYKQLLRHKCMECSIRMISRRTEMQEEHLLVAGVENLLS
jgi:hypothetical protein